MQSIDIFKLLSIFEKTNKSKRDIPNNYINWPSSLGHACLKDIFKR